MPGAAVKRQRHPVAQLPGVERRAVRRRHSTSPGAARSIERDPQRHAQRRIAGDERVLRALDRRVDAIARRASTGDAHAAFLESLARRARREQQERALRAEQIGHRTSRSAPRRRTGPAET